MSCFHYRCKHLLLKKLFIKDIFSRFHEIACSHCINLVTRQLVLHFLNNFFTICPVQLLVSFGAEFMAVVFNIHIHFGSDNEDGNFLSLCRLNYVNIQFKGASHQSLQSAHQMQTVTYLGCRSAQNAGKFLLLECPRTQHVEDFCVCIL